jgi:hypothetical protein
MEALKQTQVTIEFIKDSETPLWVFPVHLKFVDKIPVHTTQPHEEWVRLTEEILESLPEKYFYLETRTEEEIKRSCENLSVISQEFFLNQGKRGGL